MRLEAARRHGRGYDELTGLEIVHLTTDAYLDLFAKPTPDQRALLVMWGSTFAEHASVDGMSEAERRSYDGFAEVIEKGQTRRHDQGRHQPDLVCGTAPRSHPRGCRAAAYRLGPRRHAQRARRLPHPRRVPACAAA